MSKSINLSLTNELRAFVDAHCGDGSLYATPSEFVRSVLREKKERAEAAAARDAILEGYGDVIQGRTLTYRGSIRDLVAEGRRRDQEGWS